MNNEVDVVLEVYERLYDWCSVEGNRERARVYPSYAGWRVHEPGMRYADCQPVFPTLQDAVDYALAVTSEKNFEDEFGVLGR